MPSISAWLSVRILNGFIPGAVPQRSLDGNKFCTVTGVHGVISAWIDRDAAAAACVGDACSGRCAVAPPTGLFATSCVHLLCRASGTAAPWVGLLQSHEVALQTILQICVRVNAPLRDVLKLVAWAACCINCICSCTAKYPEETTGLMQCWVASRCGRCLAPWKPHGLGHDVRPLLDDVPTRLVGQHDQQHIRVQVRPWLCHYACTNRLQGIWAVSSVTAVLSRRT